jgi:hypothetical protein
MTRVLLALFLMTTALALGGCRAEIETDAATSVVVPR